MACFRCPHCGRQHAVRPSDAEEGGRCACGARYRVTVPQEEGAPGALVAEEGSVVTWAVDRDGVVYEVQFYP